MDIQRVELLHFDEAVGDDRMRRRFHFEEVLVVRANDEIRGL